MASSVRTKNSKTVEKVTDFLNDQSLSHADVEAARGLIRNKCKDNLWYFCYHILGFQDIVTSLHIDMCEKWQRRLKRRFSLWMIPRYHLKTTLWTVGGTIWELIRDPHMRILIVNAKLDNAVDILADIRVQFETNEILRWLFPEYCIDKQPKDVQKRCKWGVQRLDFPCSKYAGRKEGNIEIMGVEASLVSKHYDLMVFDDPVNDLNTATKDYRDKIERWYKNALQLRHSPQSRVRLIGTRWHFDDLYSRIVKAEHARRNVMRASNLPVKPRYLIYHRQVVERVEVGGNIIAKIGNVLPIWPERMTASSIDELLEDLGSYIFSCNPGWAPVLMSDFSEKRFDEIKEGDVVVGYTFSEFQRPRIAKSVALKVHHRKSPVVRVCFEDGTSIVCTDDHHWYTGRFQEGRSPYLPAKVGRKMVRVYDPVQEWDESDAGYLAGMIDGEGAVGHGYINISQSREYNPGVCQRLEDTLDRLGLDYVVDEPREGQNAYRIPASRSDKITLLANCDLGKRQTIVDWLWKLTGRIGKKVRVVSIEPCGETEVYSMQTTTGNYVVQGFASRNCQFMNNPLPEEDAVFKRSDIKETDYYDIPENVVTFASIDMAVEDTEKGDFTVITVASFDRDGKMYVRRVVREKLMPSQILSHLSQLCTQFDVRKVGIETVAFQKTVYKEYLRQTAKLGVRIPWTQIKRGTTSKLKRHLSMQPRVERGDFYYEGGMKNADWMIDEMTTCPRSTTDDILDTLSDIEAIYYSSPADAEISLPEDTWDGFYGSIEKLDPEQDDDDPSYACIGSEEW